MQPKVSIVIACYNKVKYIEDTFLSVYNQKWNNIELIIVNDGSTDGTRQIIEDWLLKFSYRGYEVVIIDQVNQGVAVAVRNGMMRITGEFFCTIDADDELEDQYVSMMAGWLSENSDYDWAMCDWCFSLEKGSLSKADSFDIQDSTYKLEGYMMLSSTIQVSVCVYMVRVSYLLKCKVLDNFVILPAASQEPQIFFPLQMGGGKLKYFYTVLYTYNVFASSHHTYQSFHNKITFINNYCLIKEATIEKIFMAAEVKKRLLAINPLSRFKYLYSQCIEEVSNELLMKWNDEFSHYIDNHFPPSCHIEPIEINKRNIFFLLHAIENCILNKDVMVLGSFKRIIGYGVLGSMGRNFMPKLVDSSWLPFILWDEGAKAELYYKDIPIVKPNFASITKDDLVIVYPKSDYIIQHVNECISTTSIKKISYAQGVDYFAMGFYPCFMQKNIFRA